MGLEFKPAIDQEEPIDGDNLKMNQQKAMQEVCKNENEDSTPFVNHIGLKRVYKPKDA